MNYLRLRGLGFKMYSTIPKPRTDREIYCHNCEYSNSSILWTQNADYCPNCGKHYLITRTPYPIA